MRNFLKIFLLSIFLIYFTSSFNFSYAEERNVLVKNVLIKNNQRIDTETVLSYVGIKKGDSVNYEILNLKLKEMYKTGLFADIKFRIVQNELIVLIIENPVVNNITVSGNDKIKTDLLTTEIKLKSREVFKKKQLQDTLDIFRSLYKQAGFFSAVFQPKISRPCPKIIVTISIPRYLVNQYSTPKCPPKIMVTISIPRYDQYSAQFDCVRPQ